MPVAGAVCAIATLVVGILITFLIGERKSQKPPLTIGEDCVVAEKKGIVYWPDPTQQIGVVQTLDLTTKNESSKVLVLSPPQQIKDEVDEDFTTTDNENWCKTRFTVPYDTDTSYWLETSKMRLRR